MQAAMFPSQSSIHERAARTRRLSGWPYLLHSTLHPPRYSDRTPCGPRQGSSWLSLPLPRLLLLTTTLLRSVRSTLLVPLAPARGPARTTTLIMSWVGLGGCLLHYLSRYFSKSIRILQNYQIISQSLDARSFSYSRHSGVFELIPTTQSPISLFAPFLLDLKL